MDIIWILHSIVSEMKITTDNTLPSESTHVWNLWACVVKWVKWLWWKWWKCWNQQVYKKKDSQHFLFPFNMVAAERGTPILPFWPQQHAPSVFAMQIWVFEWLWEEQEEIHWLDKCFLHYVSWDRFPDWSPSDLRIAKKVEGVCDVGRQGKKPPLFLVVYTRTRLTDDAAIS